jgi:hypothetical protein
MPMEKSRATPRSLNWIVGGSLLGVIGVMAATYLTLARTPAAGIFHDDGIYLVTAKALAEDRGYRIISVPGEPSQTKYPILFPWFVSLAWRLYPSFPDNLLWLRMVPLFAGLAWLGLSWVLLRRLGASKPEASIIVLLTAVSPWVAFLSTAIMSETLFAALLAAGLLMIVRAHEGTSTRADALTAGLLLGAAVVTRTAGLAPALAAAALFVVKKQWRSATQYVTGMAVVTLPWFWWVAQQNAATTSLDPYYSAANYASWNVITNYEVADKVRVVATNALKSGFSLISIWGIDIPPMLALAVAVAGLALLAAAFWRGRREPAVLLIAAYGAIHIAWVWPPIRFVVPVAPLLLWFAFLGAGRSRRVGCAVALVLFTVGGFQLFATVKQARERGITSPLRETTTWNDTAYLLTWLSKETPTDTVVTGNLDPMYYLFTGRRAVRAFAADPLLLYYNMGQQSENPLGTLDDFRNRLVAVKADYLVVTLAANFAEVPHLSRLISELSQMCAGSLAPAARTADSTHVIYKIDRRRLESRATCQNHPTSS